MLRACFLSGLFALSGLPLSPCWAENPDRTANGVNRVPKVTDAANRAVLTTEQLANPVKFGGFDDPKTTLQETLDHMAQRYDLTFLVRDEEFKAPMYGNILA